MIELTILGAGGALPTPNHSPAAYLVRVDGFPVVMDPGPGALVRLVKTGLCPGGVDDIDLVLVSHLHPDHTVDLISLLFALHSPLPASTAPFRLYGPGGLQKLLAAWTDIYGSWLEPRRRELVVTELAPGEGVDLPGGGRAEAFAVDHAQDRLAEVCLGYRFVSATGGTAVYSGDTGPCTSLTEAARDADLLVVECSTPDELETPGHMTPRSVGELCAAARPRRVALTHQYPPAGELDLARLVGRYHDGPIYQATDDDVFTVPDGGLPAAEKDDS